MSLNFDFAGMIKRLGKEEYDRITDSPFEKGKWHPVTDTLIWASMAVDLGEISEKNLDEWWFRLRLLQVVGNTGKMGSADRDFCITREDIANHIGMTTNVSDKTRKQWLERQFGNMREYLLPKLAQEQTAHAICAEIAAANAAAKA